jgi:16S rRNA (uracil1498-N3)-methyltransferase
MSNELHKTELAEAVTRLHVAANLGAGMAVELDEGQAHYLLHVLRAKSGNLVSLFNGRDGEWLAEIAQAGKRGVTASCLKQTEPQREPSDYLVQKAAELGVSVLQPVFTRRTIVSRINQDRMLANAFEAAEQSGRLSVPDIREAVSLDKLLAAWPKERRLLFCDEGGDAKAMTQAARESRGGPAAILTGPEGGFDPAERAALRALPFVTPVILGPRILRADTAALAALAIWQAVAGDWS